MGIGKPKKAQVDIDALMAGFNGSTQDIDDLMKEIDTAHQVDEQSAAIDKRLEELRAVKQSLQDDKRFEELRTVQQTLQAATAALNAATNRADRIIMGINTATDRANSIIENIYTAVDHANSIIESINTAINQLQSKKLGAAIHPDTLKALTEVTDNFAIQVGRQLMSHRDKQLEQQRIHEQRITRLMESHEALITRLQHEQQSIHEQRLVDMPQKSRGLRISHTWLKILFIFFLIYSLLVILYVKLG